MKENLPALSHMEQNVSHLLYLVFFDVVIAISSKEHDLADNLLQRSCQLINLTVSQKALITLSRRDMRHPDVYYSMVILAE